MKKIVYYMPRVLANDQHRTTLDFLKLVGKNASAIDRTNNFKLPFDTHIIWKIPNQLNEYVSNTSVIFTEEMLHRARSLLATNLPVVVFYSGGLDSTGLLVALDYVITTEHFSKDQLTIATSVDAMYENFDCWWSIVIKYNIVNIHECLNNLRINSTLYVMGENADQLFGSDKIFQLPRISNMLLTGKFTDCNLNIYLDELTIDKSDLFLTSLYGLVNSSPFEIETMSELLWWINFSCKWQSVSLRTWCFTDILANNLDINADNFKHIETFYNTDRFQQISMLKTFNRFGDVPSPESYKYELRKFILHMQPAWKQYTLTKIKTGSLFNVVRHRRYEILKIYWDPTTKMYNAE